MAATVTIKDGSVYIEMKGIHKILSFKGHLEIPLTHITKVHSNPEITKDWFKGLRMPGINIPGLITAGTFRHENEKVFWDVSNPEKAIIIELADEEYAKIIVEVDDPAATVSEINQNLSS